MLIIFGLNTGLQSIIRSLNDLTNTVLYLLKFYRRPTIYRLLISRRLLLITTVSTPMGGGKCQVPSFGYLFFMEIVWLVQDFIFYIYIKTMFCILHTNTPWSGKSIFTDLDLQKVHLHLYLYTNPKRSNSIPIIIS